MEIFLQINGLNGFKKETKYDLLKSLATSCQLML